MFATKPAVDCELDRLEKEGIIKNATHSEWVSPVVAVLKAGGHLRLCGDYIATFNSVLKVDQYNTKTQRSFCVLSWGTKVYKIYLAHAYHLKKTIDSLHFHYTSFSISSLVVRALKINLGRICCNSTASPKRNVARQ